MCLGLLTIKKVILNGSRFSKAINTLDYLASTSRGVCVNSLNEVTPEKKSESAKIDNWAPACFLQKKSDFEVVFF